MSLLPLAVNHLANGLCPVNVSVHDWRGGSVNSQGDVHHPFRQLDLECRLRSMTRTRRNHAIRRWSDRHRHRIPTRCAQHQLLREQRAAQTQLPPCIRPLPARTSCSLAAVSGKCAGAGFGVRKVLPAEGGGEGASHKVRSVQHRPQEQDGAAPQ